MSAARLLSKGDMRPHIAVCGEMVKEGAQRLVVHGGEQRQPTWASEVFGADSADEETSLTVSTRLPGGCNVHTFDEFRNLQEELGTLGSSADCASPMEADGMPSTSDHHEVRRLPAVEPPGHHFEVAVDEQQAPLQQHHHPSALATSEVEPMVSEPCLAPPDDEPDADGEPSAKRRRKTSAGGKGSKTNGKGAASSDNGGGSGAMAAPFGSTTSGSIKRPPGRSPKGKLWDSFRGEWMTPEEARVREVAAAAAARTGRGHAVASAQEADETQMEVADACGNGLADEAAETDPEEAGPADDEEEMAASGTAVAAAELARADAPNGGGSHARAAADTPLPPELPARLAQHLQAKRRELDDARAAKLRATESLKDVMSRELEGPGDRVSASMLKGWVDELSQCETAVEHAKQEISVAESAQALLDEAVRCELEAEQQRAALEEQQAAVQAARKKYQELVKAARAAEAHEAQARATLKATLAKHAMQSA